jgi:hypothetical protein
MLWRDWQLRNAMFYISHRLQLLFDAGRTLNILRHCDQSVYGKFVKSSDAAPRIVALMHTGYASVSHLHPLQHERLLMICARLVRAF